MDYDYIVIGSGFGGSVSALRLAQKGYRVLVLEKGRRYAAEDFPKTNWNLRRWLWIPALRFFGFFKITLFRHIMVFSGVGVGGGSLVYANTLAHPVPDFFRSPSWNGLADWEGELEPHYRTVLRMLGGEINPKLGKGDLALQRLAVERGRAEHFSPARVAVYFGEPGEPATDPYFNGAGPERAGCTHCGSCMTGCRHGAKNTLDKNYLYLAESLGVSLLADSEVFDVLPQADEGGYLVRWRHRR
ncbi:MAG TPA: NAD(P)-binding protein, partial [Spirochaetia bacterium]|nr:NAD(P)-binding protein [Spirochaetia bacterium]